MWDSKVLGVSLSETLYSSRKQECIYLATRNKMIYSISVIPLTCLLVLRALGAVEGAVCVCVGGVVSTVRGAESE